MNSPQHINQTAFDDIDDESSIHISIQHNNGKSENITSHAVESEKTFNNISLPSKRVSSNIIDSFIYNSLPEQAFIETDNKNDELNDVTDELKSVSINDEKKTTEVEEEDATNIVYDPHNKLMKNPLKSVTIPGEYTPDVAKNPLLGARCIFCLTLINPAPIVKCEECEILNPYICIQCFKDGSESTFHSFNHKYTLIDPKGPQLFKTRSGKKSYGIMEDVAILQMLCEYTRENWIEKNIVFPELSYDDALDRLEDLLMSDIGTYIRNNDPVVEVRRLLPDEYIERFGLETEPNDVIKMKKSMPKPQTRFCKFMEITDNLPDEILAEQVDAMIAEGLKIDDNNDEQSAINSSKLNIDEFEDQAHELKYDENGMPIKQNTTEDNMFNSILKHVNNLVKNNKIEGMIPLDTDDTSLDNNLEKFDPEKFFEMLKERKENEIKQSTEEDVITETSPSPDRKEKKKQKINEINSPSSPEDKKPKKFKKSKKISFTQQRKLFEQKRRLLAEERRRLREEDKKSYSIPSSGHDDSLEMGTLPEDEVIPAFQATPTKKTTDIPTAKDIAMNKLDTFLEVFHRNIGFKSDDDWSEKIDDQFGRALDKYDNDYFDEEDPNVISASGIQPGYDDGYGAIIRKKIYRKCLKTRKMSKHSKAHKQEFHNKWNPKFDIEEWRPTPPECNRFDSGMPASTDPTDSFYHVYEAAYDNKEVDPKTMTEVSDVLTYNMIRHDYDIENLSDGETILNLLSTKHEAVDIESMVRLFKINCYQRILKERSAQASIAREYELIPSFMEITKTHKEPVGHYPFLDEKFDSIGMGHLKDKYRQFFIPLYQVATKNMFDDYFKSLIKVEDLKMRINELQTMQKKGETSLQD